MSIHDSKRLTFEQLETVVHDDEIEYLCVHPLNERIYGKLEPDPDLVKSIKEHGVLEPILVINMGDLEPNGEYKELKGRHYTYIISGHRRYAAAQAAGLKKVPVRTIEHLNRVDGHLLGVERMLIESNRQREKTLEIKGREFSELERIEAALAKERQEKGVKANLPEGSKGQARNIAAKKVGLKPRTAEKLKTVIQAADNGNAAARAGLNKINETGRGVEPVYQAVIDKPNSSQPPPTKKQTVVNPEQSASVILPNTKAREKDFIDNLNRDVDMLIKSGLTAQYSKPLIDCLSSMAGQIKLNIKKLQQNNTDVSLRSPSGIVADVHNILDAAANVMTAADIKTTHSELLKYLLAIAEPPEAISSGGC